MSFDRTSGRRRPAPHRLATILTLCGATLLLATACGHKKAPKPPPSQVPQKVVVQVHQRGHEAILSFPFPSTTISGTALPGISKIEIWQLARVVPDFAVEMLLEEAAARREAQALLDELGLPLWETPAVDCDPLVPDPSGAPCEPGEAASGESTADPEGPKTGDETPVEGAPSGAEPEEAADEDEQPAEPASGEETSESTDEPGAEGEEAGEGEPVLSAQEQLAVDVETARNLLKSPETPKDTFITATLKDFKDEAELALTLEADDIGGALIGDSIVVRLPFPNVVILDEEGETSEVGFLFAARVFALNGKPSDLSERVAVLPVETPAAPGGVTVEAQATGVRIEWTSDEDPEGGFRIYRRDAQHRMYGAPVGTAVGSLRFFTDLQAIYGARYIYGVTALASAAPLLESDISSEHEIDYQDRFGPGRPGGLVAFPETGRVRLLWTTVADLDVAGYEVLRRATIDDEPAVVTSELVTVGQYVDEAVSAGEVWLYTVVAIDQLGNRSDPSIETEARVP